MDKATNYRARAEEFRVMALEQTSEDAREYYEALERDFLKLAAREETKVAEPLA
jgi:hypothetical protein